MLLAPLPWAARPWALPVLTALAPSARYDTECGRRHKTLPDWAGQLLLAVRRWWPDRPIVAVADSTYAALPLLRRCSSLPVPITFIARLRLDAAPEQILTWFVQRWQLEVTFEEARRHLGVETQRQWSDRAIARTTPALLGLFSLVTLLADRPLRSGGPPLRQAAWYQKTQPTFVDALATVRRQLWAAADFSPVPRWRRRGESTPRPRGAPHRHPLLRHLICASRAKNLSDNRPVEFTGGRTHGRARERGPVADDLAGPG